jgi:hypothetical protein
LEFSDSEVYTSLVYTDGHSLEGITEVLQRAGLAIHDVDKIDTATYIGRAFG